ncbi:MAG TPA: protease HtpX [Accumulibacter sp.]|jgi:heat shock protein HtpX|nr:protease HtpX [Accumulibacter sp.]HQC80878.1 protease HtpX [Accumulibacter sp.]
MKRIILLIATNLAIMVVLGLVCTLTGANRFFAGGGLNLGKLLLFAMIMGFGGAFLSLLMSRTIAKWSTGAQVIDSPSNSTEFWLLETVRRFADKAGLSMPEVAIYDGEPNAFATGASRDSSLVAVSTGLLQTMSREEAEAVIAHEVAHIANGDMVTLTLIQGVVNTFVFFLARVVGWVVDNALRKDDDASGPGIGYTVTVVVCDIVFGVLASIIVMYFSRQREFRADAGAARLMGTPQPMMAALRRLGGLEAGALPQNVATSGINGRPGWMELFSSHPPIEERIAALGNGR